MYMYMPEASCSFTNLNTVCDVSMLWALVEMDLWKSYVQSYLLNFANLNTECDVSISTEASDPPSLPGQW